MEKSLVNDLERNLEVAANSVIEGLKSFEEEAFLELEKEAPETTIKTRVLWGSPDQLSIDYTEIDFDYKTFLKAIMMEFLTSRASVPDKYCLSDEVEYDLFIEGEQELSSLPAQRFWNNYLGSLKTRRGGGLAPKNGDLWMPSLPAEAMEEMRENISKNIDRSSPFHVLSYFPKYLNSQNGPMPKEKFLASLSHELTHLYILENTDVKKFMARDPNREVRGLFENSTIETVEESFAYVSGEVISDYEFVSEGYSEPQRIEWCIEIIREKMNDVDDSEIDWVREEAAIILRNIEQKGLVSKGGGKKDPLIYFLKSCLPESEKNRLKRFNQIIEEDLSKSYKELQKAVIDGEKFEKSIKNKEVFEECRRVESEVDWNNPSEIENIVLHRVLEESIGQSKLSEIHQNISKALKKELKQLNQIIEKFTELENKIDDKRVDRELKKSIKDLQTSKKELEELIN